MNKVELSIILPAYNEAEVLVESVENIRNVLDRMKSNYEIIIAEDGSTDGTDKIAKMLSQKHKNVRWLHSDKRLGRGKAVANAIKKTDALIVGYVDVDLEVSAMYIPALVQEVENGFDIVVGWRFYKFDWKSILRIITSKMYGFLVRLMLSVNLKDTETGYKFFDRKKILPLLDEIGSVHWFWDTEIMIRSYYKGLKIKEIPVLFIRKWERKSKVNLIKDAISYFGKLWNFRNKIEEIKQK